MSYEKPHELFREPTCQVDADHAADLLRHSGNRAERDRLVAIARREGYLLPAFFAPDVSRAKEADGDYAAFSYSGNTPEPMTEERAELLGSSNDGRALLARMNLKPNPATFADDGEVGLRTECNRLLSHTEAGRDVLRRRGFDSLTIERMQRLG
jgi:hypothetical protein